MDDPYGELTIEALRGWSSADWLVMSDGDLKLLAEEALGRLLYSGRSDARAFAELVFDLL